MAFAMNCRLRRFYMVRRNKLILSANGRHCYADHARAKERNPKQFHFRLRGLTANCTLHFPAVAASSKPRTTLTPGFSAGRKARAE
ncbi:hypothetical protein MES4922_300058 [Mesorhizobium ventifaucium]|uniref:Uncharacterized protein n=1 Tax=Mesorhizobium ventifaucium TaxID=666020 RepID=A0ABN8JXR9_9HYPH|nr:hypothetical protein MES4922_300058 [Mesorhizobium ventifaucium]